MRAIICCFLLLLPLTATAQLPPQIEADFKNVSGYIIMPIGNEYLVDLDVSANLKEGDILTIVTPGEKVIHPISKEVLGSLDIPIGYLQVTRIKSGYSYAKLLYSDTKPQKGQQVQRYEQVPAVFVDKQGNGDNIRQNLMAGLPHLSWLTSQSTEKLILTFTLQNNKLTVSTDAENPIYSYSIKEGELTAPNRLPVSSGNFQATQQPKKQILDRVANKVLGAFSSSNSTSDMGLETGSRGLSRPGTWMGPSLNGNPIGIAVSDFTGDGQQETAIAFADKLIISRIIDKDYKQVAEIAIPKNLNLLSLEAVDLDQNGTKELYLSALAGDKLSSIAIEYRDGTFQITLKKIDWFLRSVDFPDRGTILIGQRKGGLDEPFFDKPFQINRTGDELSIGETLPLPKRINLYAFLPFKDEQNKLLYAYVGDSDYLHVMTADGLSLWESGEYFGGSETFFDLKPQLAGNDDIMPRVYIGSRLLKGPSNEILVAQNDGIRTLQRYRMYKESRMIALTWNGFAMNESWRTSDQNGYLADFALADSNNDGDKEIVMAIKFKHKSLLEDARSTIVTYQLN